METLIKQMNNLGYVVHLDQKCDLSWDLWLYNKNIINHVFCVFNEDLDVALHEALEYIEGVKKC